VDSALLGHPRVAEAVAFAAPDEKYGEIVAAAVVLTQPAGGDADAITADIRKYAATKLAKFKVTPHALAVPVVLFACMVLRTCICNSVLKAGPCYACGSASKPCQQSWPFLALNSLCRSGAENGLHSTQSADPIIETAKSEAGRAWRAARACEAGHEWTASALRVRKRRACNAVTQGSAVSLQVPERIFITDKLPKTATGKIQRRHMVGHFMGADKGGGGGGGGGGVKKNPTAAAGAPAIRSKL